MKKSTKIGILICVFVIVLGFALNPFYWLMKPTEKSEQPEISSQEKQYFQKLEKQYNSKIKRFYYNKTTKGEDTLYSDYTHFPFEYSLSIDGPEKLIIQNDSVLSLAAYVKNKILYRNKNLKKLSIYKNYEEYSYDYDKIKDTLILRK